jgi:ABC-type ATPase involved in cell division
VFQLLRDINALGTAVVMATHNLDLVRKSEFRVIEINRGHVVFDAADEKRRVPEITP